MIRLDWPEWSMSGTRIEGEILHEDRFGNLITNLPATSFLNDTKALQIWLTNDTQPTQVEIHTTYGHGPDGTFALITGSTGYLEWAIKNGNAAKVTGWKAGDHFQLTRLPMV